MHHHVVDSNAIVFRGDDVSIRYRRLDMNCTRTKTDAAIAITRGLDQ